MKLHENQELFFDLIEVTALELQLPPIFIEKDYWVTYILKNISTYFKNDLIFKGGTSLSKAYNIIERFSEDIDLAIVTNEMNSNAIKSFMKKVEQKILDENFLEQKQHPQVSKGSQYRKTVHKYSKLYDGEFGYANENIIFELNSFAKPTPYESKKVSSYIGIFLSDKDMSLIEQYELEEFEINVLHNTRTFCEKISALARASHNDDETHLLIKEKIRHLYDLHYLLKQQNIQEFIENTGFNEMMETVREDDKLQFENQWNDLLHQTNIFKDTKKILLEIESYYKHHFEELVFNENLPSIEEIIESIKKIGIQLRKNNL